MHVTILHNAATDEQGRPMGFHDGYLPHHELKRVFAFTLEREGHPADDTYVLGNVYHLFNVGDDPEWGEPSPIAVAYRAKRLRSLSVGDVVILDGRAYQCDHSGWSRLADDQPATPEQVQAHIDRYNEAVRAAGTW